MPKSHPRPLATKFFVNRGSDLLIGVIGLAAVCIFVAGVGLIVYALYWAAKSIS